jgi:hypothetical protein
MKKECIERWKASLVLGALFTLTIGLPAIVIVSLVIVPQVAPYRIVVVTATPSPTPSFTAYLETFPDHEELQPYRKHYDTVRPQIRDFDCNLRTCTVTVGLPLNNADTALAVTSAAYFYLLDYRQQARQLDVCFCTGERRQCDILTLPVTGDFDADLQQIAEK